MPPSLHSLRTLTPDNAAASPAQRLPAPAAKTTTSTPTTTTPTTMHPRSSRAETRHESRMLTRPSESLVSSRHSGAHTGLRQPVIDDCCKILHNTLNNSATSTPHCQLCNRRSTFTPPQPRKCAPRTLRLLAVSCPRTPTAPVNHSTDPQCSNNANLGSRI